MTTLFILLLILDFVWINVNWFELILDYMDNAPNTESSLCVFESIFLILGIWWLSL